MKYLIITLMIVLTGCEDRYRYPCQDPANWDSAECNPPICTASGTCTADTLKQNPCGSVAR
jgi:hypothetical protein